MDRTVLSMETHPANAHNFNASLGNLSKKFEQINHTSGQHRAKEPSANSSQKEPGNSKNIGSKPEVPSSSYADMVVIKNLKARDRQVRNHEQAHLNAAGSYASGGANFSYTTGPDGQQYATGGEVGIDMSEEATPEATLKKMETVVRAALAPAQPSAADRQVAGRASIKAAKAKQDIQSEQQTDLDAAQKPSLLIDQSTNREAPKDSSPSDTQVTSFNRTISMTQAISTYQKFQK